MTGDHPMTDETRSPYRAFTETLGAFADGEAHIRNPFVVVAVDPSVERRTAVRLDAWATEADELPAIDDVTVRSIWLDELITGTTVYELSVVLRDETPSERIEETMRDRLAHELVAEMVENEIEDGKLATHRHVVLLLHLGSLYPFTHASELLDELDRRNVASTVGIPVPCDVADGTSSSFDWGARDSPPAHRVTGRIREVHLRR